MLLDRLVSDPLASINVVVRVFDKLPVITEVQVPELV